MDKNAPLYLRTYPSVSDLSAVQLQEVMYNSLDVVEERTNRHRPELGNFVGCLAVVGMLSVYGTVTATGRKVLAAIVTQGQETKDSRVRMLFRKIESIVVRSEGNCLRKLDDIGGETVERAVRDVVEWFG